jgi:Uma2 family endonuclease
MPIAKSSNNDISEQDYLEGEKVSTIKHEYSDGQVYAMAGSSKRHNRIVGNIYRALLNGQKQNCDVYIGDIKVHINQGKRYYYPDVVVGCEEDDNANDHYLEKPCLIVEVLSPSTERKDGTEKLVAYQNIDSLQAYMLVDQSHCKITLISRQANGHLELVYYKDMEAVIAITCPDMLLKVSDIYQAVIFDD